MTRPPTVAVLLAAGLGQRLHPVLWDRPKGLLDLGGETLVGRSIRLLRQAGLERLVIVAGHEAHAYQELARKMPEGMGIEVLINPDYARDGSMASLACALEAVGEEDLLVLESDLVYEQRALPLLLGDERPDAILVSGPTGAGDEVWATVEEGERLVSLSKQLPAPRPGPPPGEFVGISRISQNLGRELLWIFRDFVTRTGHGRLEYDTGALALAAGRQPIGVCRIPDLLWGEIDDPGQLRRVTEIVLPTLSAREAP